MGRAVGTLGLERGFILTCVCHGAAHSVATGSQESIPRQAGGAARRLRTWLGNWHSVTSSLFHRSKHLRGPPTLKGRGPRPRLFTGGVRNSSGSGVFKPPQRSLPLFPFLFPTSPSSPSFSAVTRMYGIMCLVQTLCSVFQQHAKDKGPSRLSTRSPMSSMLCRGSESVAMYDHLTFNDTEMSPSARAGCRRENQGHLGPGLTFGEFAVNGCHTRQNVDL